MAKILYPTDDAQTHRHSSIDQFKGFLATYRKGGWAPIIFDQLDGITCEEIKTHPIAIDLTGNSLGYIFPEAHCTYASDKFITFDQKGVEQRPLPACFGGQGEFYDVWIDKSAFINYSNGTSVGVHNTKQLRTGLSVVKANKTLPAVD